MLNTTHPRTCTLTFTHRFQFLTSFRLPQPHKLSGGREAACIWDLKRVGENWGALLPCYVPHHSLLFPSQAVSPNRYLNVRRISARPGLRPGPPGNRGGGASFPGAHMAWGGTRIPLVSVSAPRHRIVVPPPGAPRAQRRLGRREAGGGVRRAELCLAIYSLVSAGGGVGHQTVPPPKHI